MLKSKRIIIAVITLVVIIVAITIVCVAKKPIVYNKACKNLESGDYNTAARQFDSLDGYKDSDSKYDESMTLSLESQIEELLSDSVSECKPIEYYTILEKCERLEKNGYYSNLDKNIKDNLAYFSEYVKFLSYVFNFDSSHEFLKIDCDSNPYFGINLKSFYNDYYKKYEKQLWVATDKYNYFDDLVTTHIEVETSALLKLKDENKPYSDANIRAQIRVYVSYEGYSHDTFSESAIVPVKDLSNVQITTDVSNLSDYYDTSEYKKEMGASNVAFVINFNKKIPTIKYAPNYIENEAIHTLKLKKQ